MPTILEQGNKAAIDAVRAEKPSQFTVGGHLKDGRLVGGITYDRKLANGWGLTAYARAWWEDATVTVGPPKLKTEAGAEIVKKF